MEETNETKKKRQRQSIAEKMNSIHHIMQRSRRSRGVIHRRGLIYQDPANDISFQGLYFYDKYRLNADWLINGNGSMFHSDLHVGANNYSPLL